jgi:hypothetical protein
MNDRATSIETEIASIERKADQSCSIHAQLRDHYARLASWLDYSLMAATTYLLALAFVEPVLGLRLTFGAPTQIVNAFMTLAAFFLSVVQFKNEWKSKAHDHQVTVSEYASVKKECRLITSGARSASLAELQRIRAIYDSATEKGTDIPNRAFAPGKAAHLRKVYVSRYLDAHPGAWVTLVKLKLVLRDNLGLDLLRWP